MDTLVHTLVVTSAEGNPVLETELKHWKKPALFERFYHEVSDLNTLSEKLPKDLNIKIQTFALHLFSRGSTLPLVSDKDEIDRSPLDFLKEEHNKALYYRGDGSPILRSFILLLKICFKISILQISTLLV